MGRKYTDNIYEDYDSNKIILKIKYKNEYINCFCDKEDEARIKAFHWRTSHKKNKIYIVTGKSGNINSPLTYLHNFLLNYTPVPQWEVNHIDGNSCNNCKSNLRIVTRQQNIDNTKVRCDHQMGIRGVSYNKKTGKYICDFVYHGTRFYFKNWNTAAEAVCCRWAAEQRFQLETLVKNPLSASYIDQLSVQQQQKIKDYVYDKISQKETV